MVRRRVTGLSLAGLLALLLAGPDRAAAQTPLNLPVVLPNIIMPGLTVPGVTIQVGGTAVVALPGLNVPSVNVLNTAGLPSSLNLPLNAAVLLVNLPGVSILAPALAQLSVLGNGALGLVLNQVGQVDQLLAATIGANLLTPVDQVLNAVTSGGPAAQSPWGASGTFAVSGSVAPLGVPNAWMWNSVTIGSSRHAGFHYQAGSGDGAAAGTAPSLRSVDKVNLPGVLWDASSSFGLRRGMLHVGVVGGVAESDVKIASNGYLRDAGIAQAGAAHLTSWSLGGFALVTTGSWYTAAALGGSWGRSEVDNLLLGATSDYRTSGFTSAWILGTIVPITSTIRFDLRGSLGYQHTVGESHVDTLGIGYGEHVVETVNGSLSGRVFGVLRQDSVTIRPYLQAGLAHRFHQHNALQVEGVGFTFDDADTSMFAATGIDLEVGESLQLTIGGRRDHSADFDSLSARFGVALRLN